MHEEVKIKNLIQKDRIIVLCVLSAIALGAWAYMFQMSPGIAGIINSGYSPCMIQWGFVDIALLFVMWSIMMVAMMLPAATPMFLIFATVNRQQNESRYPLFATGFFVLGYLIIWIAYSALATMAQWGLHTAALLSQTMTITSPLLGGALLLTAGVYQWTPFRDACMAKCRSPLGFILAEWREGKRGALIMGFKHGAFCVGCCWILMALSLVLGTMNLLWMAALTVFMLLEKNTLVGKWLSWVAGLVFVVWGLAVIFSKGTSC